MNVCGARVAKDIKEIADDQGFDSPPIFVESRNDSLSAVDCLVIGPPDTPYAGGFYNFVMKFKFTYPNDAPECTLVTTDNGKVRFNPNLYADGLVCLSILGTWRGRAPRFDLVVLWLTEIIGPIGESADEWRSSYGIGYILNAIQCIIMNAEPYYNEPGYEKEKSETIPKEELLGYSLKILHENIRVAVCNQVLRAIENPDSKFRTIIKAHFNCWYETYIEMAQQHIANDEKSFYVAQFEHSGNRTTGKFRFGKLIKTLQHLKEKLDEETENFRIAGVELTKNQSGNKYIRLLEEIAAAEQGNLPEGVSAGLVDKNNAYVWNISVFAPDGSYWEGGMYNMEVVVPDGDDYPRVRFLIDMLHPNISPSGVPLLNLKDNGRRPVLTVIKQVVELLKKKPLNSPATWCNPAAAKLCFSNSEEEQTKYRKAIRQIARDTMEL